MNKICAKIFFAFICLLLLVANCYAQQFVADSARQSQSANTLIKNYYNSIGEQAHLFNGPEYENAYPAIKGNAFYNDVDQFAPGDVFYDGFLYKNVPLLYDINRDLLVVLLANKVSKLYLLKERVAAFNVQSHHFVSLTADSLGNQGVIAPGFYDQVYKGRCEVLVKRSKDIQSRTIYNNIENFFNPVTYFYIKNAGSFTRVSSLGNVLKVFAGKRKELEQYIKAKQIKYKNNPEQAMVMIASYYDQITK